MKTQIKGSLILTLAAMIWGAAFVAQSAGMEYVGGFTFNCARSLIGGVVLIPCIFLLRRARVPAGTVAGGEPKESVEGGESKGPAAGGKSKGAAAGGKPGDRRRLITGGICCGIALCVASNLQQFGIKYTTVGKAGFITALYIVLVPIFGMLLHRKVGRPVWIGLIFAVVGLYFLCMDESFSVGAGDLLVLACAAVFAVHILVIDHFAPLADCVAMSCIQFFVCGFLSGIPMLIFEQVRWRDLADAAAPILYAGVLSSGCAYTMQIIGQRDLDPAVASMIMSLESVFSVLAGMIFLRQMMTGREILGCCLMFAAVVLAQLPEKSEWICRRGDSAGGSKERSRR